MNESSKRIRSYARAAWLCWLCWSWASACSLAHAGASPACRGGLDGSFIQLGRADMQRDIADWRGRLRMLAQVGARTLVVQFSGDEQGSYDDRSAGMRPVRDLLAAADELDMSVYLGLYRSRAWPHQQRTRPALAEPLSDVREANRLGALCRAYASCVGWYIPHEIDERTWSGEEGVAYLKRFLANTSRALRALYDRPIAIAPFYAESVPPRDYAEFWGQLLVAGMLDVLMLQDGAGARGTALERMRAVLRELRPVLSKKRVALWSIVELFDQTSGPPISSAAFAAVPTDFPRMRARLESERPLVEATLAFSILNYMAPDRDAAQRELYRRYAAAYCRR